MGRCLQKRNKRLLEEFIGAGKDEADQEILAKLLYVFDSYAEGLGPYEQWIDKLLSTQKIDSEMLIFLSREGWWFTKWGINFFGRTQEFLAKRIVERSLVDSKLSVGDVHTMVTLVKHGRLDYSFFEQDLDSLRRQDLLPHLFRLISHDELGDRIKASLETFRRDVFPDLHLQRARLLATAECWWRRDMWNENVYIPALVAHINRECLPRLKMDFKD
ncbi:MAG: hypothetical protein FJZ63_07320 [Chlamydiae bacterium]|nr:hypothetical protein [Chlamydiota bacterium]